MKIYHITPKLLIKLFLILFLPLHSFSNTYYTDDSDTAYMPGIEGLTNYISIDLNHDQIIDCRLGMSYFLSDEGAHSLSDNRVLVIDSVGFNMFSIGPYFQGEEIGTLNSFIKSDYLSGYIAGYGKVGKWSYYDWNNEMEAYIGIKFLINNEYHYGWIKLKVFDLSFIVIEYYFNNNSDQSVNAGQTN